LLNRRDFLPVLENRPDLCLILLKILCRRLRLTTEQVEDVIFRHLESRVAKAFANQASGYPAALNSEPLTRSDRGTADGPLFLTPLTDSWFVLYTRA
jgi:CRP-like cAMP-binding protein